MRDSNYSRQNDWSFSTFDRRRQALRANTKHNHVLSTSWRAQRGFSSWLFSRMLRKNKDWYAGAMVLTGPRESFVVRCPLSPNAPRVALHNTSCISITWEGGDKVAGWTVLNCIVPIVLASEIYPSPYRIPVFFIVMLARDWPGTCRSGTCCLSKLDMACRIVALLGTVTPRPCRRYRFWLGRSRLPAVARSSREYLRYRHQSHNPNNIIKLHDIHSRYRLLAARRHLISTELIFRRRTDTCKRRVLTSSFPAKAISDSP